MTIYEVAKRAGVSITTVSHVFSGQRPVSDKTRELVFDIAKQINYHPHRVAQSLATGKSMILGILFPFGGDSLVCNPYFIEHLDGLSTAAAKVGYAFLLIPRTKNAIDLSIEEILQKIDGAIIVDPSTNDNFVDILVDKKIPIVSTGRHLGIEGIPAVENEHGGYMKDLFDHIIVQDYHNPAIITMQKDFSYYMDKEEAFRTEALSRGIQPKFIKAKNPLEESSFDLARSILEVEKRPDIIITVSDFQAIEFLRVATDLGIRVPEDLGIVGDGNTTFAKNSIPTLTSTSVQTSLLGEKAIELLIELVSGCKEIKNEIISATVIKRESTTRTKLV
jgi:DNA-binding LacI/PurR family transcriptional regulator